jgi:hypothetical protein
VPAREQFALRRRCLFVPAKLHQRIDLDELRRPKRAECDSGASCVQGITELVARKLKAADADQHEGVLRQHRPCASERVACLAVERRVGGFADPLKQFDAEVAECRRVVRIRDQSRAQGIDPTDGRR